MEINGIFVVVQERLYAVGYEEEEGHAFQALFDRLQDVEHLEQFFEDHKRDLQSEFYGNIAIDEAVLRTLTEASLFERNILNAAQIRAEDSNAPVESVVFRSLHENDYSHIHIKSKGYGPGHKSWLRIYAIRIGPNLYVVSGGAIKLTRSMKPQHLQLELRKLAATASYLIEIGFEVEGDLGFIEIGNHEAI
jgi:hypothetical protein